MAFDTDVLIIGAGPTGSALALDLARRGVGLRLIDRAAQSFPGSRAKGVQPRSLEVLDDLGVIGEILDAGSLYPPLGVHIGPFRFPKRMLKIAQPTADVPYPNTLLIPQFSTDAILRKALVPLGVRVQQNTKLVSLEQDEASVTAVIEGPDGPETLRCRYVVGADGGASATRQHLGIAFPGKTDAEDRMIIVDCRIDGLRRDYWHVWPWLGGRFAGACPLPNSDLFQVMIRLQPGEEPDLDAEALNTRFRKQTGSDHLRLTDIRWTSVFRPNVRLAERYRQGRVFLAGDAAHVHTPMGAQGLNTGIQDGYNLGWKLAQVLAGAPDALLDSYEQERRPVAARVLGLSSAKYDALGKLDPAAIKRGKDEQQLSISYRAGPLAVAGKLGLARRQAGDRAPDARLRNRAGEVLRLFDLLRGPHFTLLACGPQAAQELDTIAWPEAGAALRRVIVGGAPGGAADRQLSDFEGAFRAAYGDETEFLLLIRPDGYIAQIAAENRPAAIAEAIARLAPEAQTRQREW